MKKTRLLIFSIIITAATLSLVGFALGWVNPSSNKGVGGGKIKFSSSNLGFGTSTANYDLDVLGNMGFRSTSFSYRKPISITNNSGGNLTDYETLISVDTASLISAGKMQSDCDDLRLMDSDGVTPLAYWTESGCNTSATQIFTRIPSIPVAGKTVYMLYGNATAASKNLEWNGSFLFMSTSTCPSGWTQFSAMDSRLPRGSSAYGGIGGRSTHAHRNFWANTSAGSSGVGTSLSISQPVALSGHTHGGDQAIVSSISNLPDYLDILFCSSASPVNIGTSFVAYFDAAAPGGWSQFTALNGKFPRGAITYGGTGGTSSHTHTLTLAFGGSSTANHCNVLGSTSIAIENHAHNFNVTTDSASTLPPYLTLIPYAPTASTYIPSGTITAFTALPPLGWTRFSALDGKFPRSDTSYGATGGEENHTHTVNALSGGSTGTAACMSGGTQVAAPGHTHTVTGTLPSESNLPPYLNVIFAEKNSPQTGAAVGAEEAGPFRGASLFFNGVSGDIGIGNTNPLYQLDISNDFSSASTSTFSGKVGVRTATPAADLDVNGTAIIPHWADESIGANGYVRMGSILFQWGKAQSGLIAEGEFTITFPTPFTNVYSVVAVPDITGYTNVIDFWIQTKDVTATNFKIREQTNGNGGIQSWDVPIYWKAIGI